MTRPDRLQAAEHLPGQCRVFRIRPLVAALLGTPLSCLPLLAQAGGFALIEEGASGLGHAYAGSAAVSNDSSTVWFNPAGMTELPDRELAIAGHILRTDTGFENRGTALNPAFGSTPISGPDTANPGTTAFLPNFYYSAPINAAWRYGIGVSVPFGSSTDYDDDWVGRYTTLESSVQVIDINPSIAWRVSDTLRLGAGFSYQRLDADLEQAVDSGAACFGAFAAADPALCANAGLLPGTQANDGRAEVSGDSTAFTFNLGVLFLPRPDLKIGASYRSSVDHTLEGDGEFETNEALAGLLAGAEVPLFADTGAEAEVDLPAMFSLSTAWQTTDRLQLLADITWTGWSSFEELRVTFDNPVQPDSLSLQEWEDVFRVSVGLNFQHSEKLTLRTGVAFDEEAIPSAQRRTARIPGNDRYWLAFGAGYRINQNASFDLGYAHLFLDETAIDNSNEETPGGSTVRGVFDPAVDIFSAQFNWQFR